MAWKKYSSEKIRETIFDALNQNVNYREESVLGLPASFLDPEVFYVNAPFLKDAPFLSTMIANPNHIGCHTLGESEPVFEGTQSIEKELIEMCATGIFKAKSDGVDGYVASGGTEANIQAFWTLRNYYNSEFDAKHDEIGLVFSEDCHYSMPKGANLLSIKPIAVSVNSKTRAIDHEDFESKIDNAKVHGIKYFIVVMNMSTTMFGSVDEIDEVVPILKKSGVNFKIHVDAAYGGFIYPFTEEQNKLTFEHPDIVSFSLDGHKMLLSPYGTGIFLVRKGMIQYVMTNEANYVKGKDYTLIGSRSGANAIAIWMIMRTYGFEGWKSKVQNLVELAKWMCEELDKRNIEYFRHEKMNIITIANGQIPHHLLERHHLVPDNHHANANWWKIVVMDHVSENLLQNFLNDIDKLQVENE